jgi:queuine tRNA-ribosyltransferase
MGRTVAGGHRGGMLNTARERRPIVAVGTTALRLLESAAEAGTIRPFRRRNRHLHNPGLPLSRRRRPDDQFPPAAIDPVHAGLRLLGLETMQRAYAHAIAKRLSLLFLWRRLPAVSGSRSMTAPFGFTDQGRDGAARRGEIATARGIVRTPAFMPVGTAGTVKAMFPDQVRATGADIVLGNTYHLMLRPGAERVAELGGLHAFMRWPHPILTDSGGFQVMSLASLRKLTRTGLPSAPISTAPSIICRRSAPSRSSACWVRTSPCSSTNACRCRAARRRPNGRCACRCAGPNGARRRSDTSRAVRCSASSKGHRAPAATRLGARAHGHRIRRLCDRRAGRRRAAGDDARDARHHRTGAARRRPRYLMGVGTPDDILRSVRRGIDMFDCVMPTRAGRHGQAFTRLGGSISATPATPPIRARSTRPVTVRRRATTAAPISTISSNPENISARCS